MSDLLYKQWKKLGVGFVFCGEIRSPVDLEFLLVQTAKEGREDSRLIFGMRGWLLENYDLVNTQRLIRLIKEEKKKNHSTAILGAVLTSIVEAHPRSSLKSILKYCQKSKKAVFVFPRIAKSEILAQLNKKENHPIWARWNLISREIGTVQGAIRKRSYILRRNQNLLLRAIFGSGIRAEILAFFLSCKKGNALHISNAVGLSYEPVYSELQQIQALHLIQDERKGRGRARVYSFCNRAQKIFSSFLPQLVN